jgi:hypothetical protein
MVVVVIAAVSVYAGIEARTIGREKFRGHHTQLSQPALINFAEVTAARLSSDTQR